MGILKKNKKLQDIKSVDVIELNRRMTHESEKKRHDHIRKGPLDGIIISEEYRTVESLLKIGCPIVFVTGNAGTGKTTLIHYLKNIMDKNIVVLAPTGVAALNAGGMTIHSFFRLPPKIHEEEDIKLAHNRKLYKKLELLMIDEVSMVRCDLMDSIDKFLRKNRSSTKPFGGVQLLLVGDLFQLPPVVPEHERNVLEARGYTGPYFFSSFRLQNIPMHPIELTSVYRQEDRSYIDVLNRVRVGEDIESVIEILNQQYCEQDDFQPDITLTCTNRMADKINGNELGNLQAEEYSFKGTIEGQFSLDNDKLPSPMDLKLKLGTRVMFTKNDAQKRWVNGTIGIVRNIEQRTIMVELVSGSRGMVYDVHPETWENYKYTYDSENDEIVAVKVGQYTQYPLMHAWAVTIHKSQGKTLDNVLIDLGWGTFTFGQVYVALSRCRSIEGFRLARPIRETDVKCDPMIKRFYIELSEIKNEFQNSLFENE
ncbi:MAG: AAA family ATPase [Syntrophaceae bacterium]|nr:AAA family ATPase [Syntrophaceae bacterium]